MILKLKDHYQCVNFCILNGISTKRYVPRLFSKGVWILVDTKTNKPFKCNNVKKYEHSTSWLA